MKRKLLSGLLAVTLCFANTVPVLADTGSEIYEAYSDPSEPTVVYSSDSEVPTATTEPYVVSSDDTEIDIPSSYVPEDVDDLDILGSSLLPNPNSIPEEDNVNIATFSGAQPLPIEEETSGKQPRRYANSAGDGTITVDNTDMPESPGSHSTKFNITYTGSGLTSNKPSLYDDAIDNLPSTVNQGAYNTCWALSTCSQLTNFYNTEGLLFSPDVTLTGDQVVQGDASDDYIARSPSTRSLQKLAELKKPIGFSTVHLAYYTHYIDKYEDPLKNTTGDKTTFVGSGDFTDAANLMFAANALSQGIGPYNAYDVNTKDNLIYDATTIQAVKYSGPNSDVSHEGAGTMSRYLLVNTLEAGYANNVKSLMLRGYGNPLIHMTFDEDESHYVESSNSIYHYIPENAQRISFNHAVEIVGWDDNKECTDPEELKSTTGAWLVRNSYTDKPEKQLSSAGYFWLAYDDGSIDTYAYFLNYTDNYRPNIYQHDGALLTNSYFRLNEPTTKGFTLYKAKANPDGEEIVTNGTFMTLTANVDYKVSLYTGITSAEAVMDPNTEPVDVVEGHADYAGMYNVHFHNDQNKAVVKQGDMFAIAVELNSGNSQIPPRLGTEMTLDSRTPASIVDVSNLWFNTAAKAEAGQDYIYYGDKYVDFTTITQAADASELTKYLGNLRIKAYTSNLKKYTVNFYLPGEKEGDFKLYTTKSISDGYPVKAFDNPVTDGYLVASDWYTKNDDNTTTPFEFDSTLITGNTNIYANMTNGTYKVTYHSNITGNAATYVDTVTFNTNYTVQNNQYTNPDSKKNVFIGWNDKANGSGKSYLAGEVVQNIAPSATQDADLYAQWSDGTVKVTYHVDSKTTQKSGKIGENIPAYGDSDPTKTGYKFKFWSRSLEKPEAYSTTGNKLTGNLDLYAIWDPITYTLVINRNIDSEDLKQQTHTLKYDETLTLTADMFAAQGYTLSSFNTKADGTGNIYHIGQSISKLTEKDGDTVNLYGWWAVHQYKYRVFSVELDRSIVPETLVDYGTVMQSPNFSEKGYTCEGYFDDTEYKQAHDFEKPITADTTVYAYIKPYSYTIKFHPGSCKDTSYMDDLVCNYGTSYTLPPCTFSEENSGYFLSWNTKEDGSGTRYDDGQSIINLSEEDGAELDFYARWSVDPCKVIFDTHDGSKVDPVSVKYGELLPKIEAPSREYYLFDGWYRDATYKSPFVIGTDKVAGDMTLHAKWNKANYYITFDGNGVSGTMNKIEAWTGQDVRLSPCTFVSNGLDFLGWATDPNATEPVYKDGDTIPKGIKTAEQTLTLYALWDKRVCHVVFIPNVAGQESQDFIVNYGSYINSTDVVIPTSPTDDFVGWYYDVTFKKPYKFTDQILSTKTAIYAKWGQDWGDIEPYDEIKAGKFENSVKAVPEDIWIWGAHDVEYTGSAVKFSDLKVFYYKTLLVEGRDYVLSYSNNTKLSTTKNASVTATGKGKYKDAEACTEEFKITPWSLGYELEGVVYNSENIKIDDYTYALTTKTDAIRPVVSFTYNNKTTILKYGTDYKITELPALDTAGSCFCNIEGMGNYTGVAQFIIRIIPFDGAIDISKLSIDVQKVVNATDFYDSDLAPIEEPVNILPEVKIQDRSSGKNVNLVLGEHFTLSGHNNDAPGKATCTITGIAPYYGQKVVPFTIKGLQINRAKVSPKKLTLVYGEELSMPDLTLTYKVGKNTVELLEGTHYTASFKTPSKTGRSKLVIYGKGIFGGSKSIPVVTQKLSIKDDPVLVTVTGATEPFSFYTNESVDTFDVNYTKGGAKPEVVLTCGGRTLVQGSDYTVSYSNCKKPTTNKPAKMKIKGKGFFKGTITAQYNILPPDIGDVVVTTEGIFEPTRTALNLKPTFSITDATSGAKLKAGKDYDKKISYVYVSGPDGSTNITIQRKVKGKFGEATVSNNSKADPDTDCIPAGVVLEASIKGKGLYADTTFTCQFSCFGNGLSIKKANVKSTSTYTGSSSITNDDLVVKVGKEVLTLGTDYMVKSAKVNNKKGFTTVELVGINSYTGSVTAKLTFKKTKK